MPLRTHTRRSSIPILEFERDEHRDNTAQMQAQLAESIVQGLSKPCPKESEPFAFTKTIPTIVLYDEKGLSLYTGITEEPDYYLFDTERDILLKHGDDICKRMFPRLFSHKETPRHHSPSAGLSQKNCSTWGDYESGVHNHGVNGSLGDESPRAYIVELGAGNLKKTGVLLDSLSHLSKAYPGPRQPHTEYFAVDLEREELATTLEDLVATQPGAVSSETPNDHRVAVSGINASFDQLMPNLGPKSGLFPNKSPKSFWWLGSSVGNLDFTEAVGFFKSFSTELNPGDTFLVGIDSTKSKEQVELAYDDRNHTTQAFILNGMDAVSRLLAKSKYTGATNFSKDTFSYVHRFNPQDGCHEAFVRAKQDITCNGPYGSFHIHQDELIRIERSFKFNATQIAQFWNQSGLRPVNSWHHDKYDYGLYLCEKPPVHFFSSDFQLQRGLNPFGVPALEDWNQIWKVWDTVTIGMIPEGLMHVKPIDLRHKILFYLGHIPAFLQIHLSKHFGESFTEPASYASIFERGIDPHVDDPDQCHDHSEVPVHEEDWPKLQEIIEYRDRVRQRLNKVYTSGKLREESEKSRRLGRVLSMVFEHEGMHLETLLYMLVQIGDQISTPPGFIRPDWQASKAVYDRQVAEEEEARQKLLHFPSQILRMGQEDKDYEDGEKPLTKSHVFGWDNENGVRDVNVEAFKIAPVPVSNDEYLAFLQTQGNNEDFVPASWKKLENGEWSVRVVYSPGHVDMDVAKHWPVQASHNQLSAYATSKQARLPTEPELRIFLNQNPQDHPVANTGFRNWHPVASRPPTSEHPASNGGVWEWTSTNFESYPGYSRSLLYPGYSCDFFDGSHNIILGGSWATVPRISGRSTFRNWFQKNYPYVFCGARLVYPV